MQEYLAAIGIIEKLKSEIIYPIIWLLMFLSFIYFLYGVYEFISEKDSKKLEKAKEHVQWGLIGLFIIVAAAGIIKVISDTIISLSV